MVDDLIHQFWTVTTILLEGIPGDAYDSKIEFVANVLGIAGFVISVGLLIFGPLARRGRRRPATQGDLEKLSSAVVDMIGERVAAQLLDKATAQLSDQPALSQAEIKQTRERVNSDLTTAIAAVADDHSREGEVAAAGLVQGDTSAAERLFETRAEAALGSDPASAAEQLHLQAALRSTHDLPGALSACLRALDINPNDALGWSRIGHLYLRMGRSADARQAFDRALALESKGQSPVSITAAASGDRG